MATTDRGRDYGIDALRGLAILAMLASHLAREVLVEPHPLWLRAFSSLAAPLFITLAGMMAVQTSTRYQRPISYYLQRGGVILLLAALVDVIIWRLYPFVGCDVLYLIAIAIPLTAVFSRLSWRWQAGVMAAVVLLPSWVRLRWGYPADVVSQRLSEPPGALIAEAPRIAQQWLICGWFPLLPWLAFSFLGVWLFRWTSNARLQAKSQMQLAAAALAILAALLQVLWPASVVKREGYTELFYPPSLAYLAAAAAVVLVLYSLRDAAVLRANHLLVRLGRCALLMYLVHLAILRWVVARWFEEVSLQTYLLLYLALGLVLAGAAGAVNLGKQRTERPLPFMLRMLLGS